MTTQKTRKKRTTRQKEIKALDALFSEFIRKRAILQVGGCERCHKYHPIGELEAAHYKTRVKFSTRWDERNAAGLCSGCHRYFHREPEECKRWFRHILGEKEFNNVELRSLMTAKEAGVDRAAIRLYLTEQIKLLGGEG